MHVNQSDNLVEPIHPRRWSAKQITSSCRYTTKKPSDPRARRKTSSNSKATSQSTPSKRKIGVGARNSTRKRLKFVDGEDGEESYTDDNDKDYLPPDRD